MFGGCKTEIGSLLHPIYVLYGSYISVLTSIWMVQTNRKTCVRTVEVNKKLSVSSFFIYAFHCFLLRRIYRIISLIVGFEQGVDTYPVLEYAEAHPYISIFSYFLTFFIIIIICIITFLTLKKLSPELLKIVCGRS